MKQLDSSPSKIFVPPIWTRSVKRICGEQRKRILVIGASDRGKSTYCQYLIKQLRMRGARVALVDGDIGQTDLGPPAAISMGYAKNRSKIDLSAIYFVGDVSPMGHFLPMVVGMRKLVDCADADFIVMNTTGFVSGAGVVLNWFQIEALQPDLIIALEKGRELDPILQGYRNLNVFRIRPSIQARKKSPSYRKMAREKAFRIYFRSSRRVTFDLKNLIVQRQFPLALEEGRLCGFANQANIGVGLGIIKRLRNGKISVLTPVPKRKIQAIQFGNLWVDQNGKHKALQPPQL